MDQGQRDFEWAWKRLTTQGDAGGPTPPRDFAPVGLRKDVRETGPLYHGTKADLQVGDFLHPGFASNYGSGRRANFVYVTAIQAARPWRRSWPRAPARRGSIRWSPPARWRTIRT